MDSRTLKDTVYGHLARVGKALASPVRLEVLDLLAQAPRTVEDLAREVDATVANTSQHLQVLRGARLVEADKRGQHVHYRLADASVSHLAVALRHMGDARLAEIDQVRRAFQAERGALEPIPRAELLARVARDEVTVLDVRAPEEFRAGHFPGARSVPLSELTARLDELPRDRSVVAYCRGPWCVLALDAVQMLRAAGFVAAHVEEGVADWRAAGFPVAVGA
ncbi:MAG: metalloregulator ArsR/SmtB family transcription factor [Pseudomonadota bacterium]|nr:metalloregulator ArsR/SmtB family transcription factor [Pseudomonadota bacterium]